MSLFVLPEQPDTEKLNGIEQLYGRKLSPDENAEARLNLIGLLEVLIEVDQEVTAQNHDAHL